MLKKQQKKKSKETLNSKKAKDQSEIDIVPVFRWSIASEGKSSQQKGKEKVYNLSKQVTEEMKKYSLSESSSNSDGSSESDF